MNLIFTYIEVNAAWIGVMFPTRSWLYEKYDHYHIRQLSDITLKADGERIKVQIGE